MYQILLLMLLLSFQRNVFSNYCQNLAITYFYIFAAGLGVSFWRFAAFVAVMEYFTRHRMTAIILSGFGRVIGILVGYGILARPYQDARDVSIMTLE